MRVGGRGILIDDAGSGSWIALRALDETFRCLDRSGSFTEVQALAEELFAVIGGDDWPAVPPIRLCWGSRQIGTLATAVAKAAARGDRMSLAILGAGRTRTRSSGKGARGAN